MQHLLHVTIGICSMDFCIRRLAVQKFLQVAIGRRSTNSLHTTIGGAEISAGNDWKMQYGFTAYDDMKCRNFCRWRGEDAARIHCIRRLAVQKFLQATIGRCSTGLLHIVIGDAEFSACNDWKMQHGFTAYSDWRCRIFCMRRLEDAARIYCI